MTFDLVMARVIGNRVNPTYNTLVPMSMSTQKGDEEEF